MLTFFKNASRLVMLGLIMAGCATVPPTADVRMNEIQVIGTHNSYHLRPHDSLMTLIAKVKPAEARSLDYGHRTLTEQLSEEGIRQIELDCYVDTTGGRFADPLGPKKVIVAGLPPVPPNDPTGKLLKPGIKVLHVPDVDFGSSVLTLVDGLQEVRAWSLKHPRHVPIFILIELKDQSVGAGFTQAEPWSTEALVELEREILSVFPQEGIIKPDDIRGDAKTLPAALQAHGWPTLNAARGKVMFGMDNEGREQAEYLAGHPALEGRILFVSVPPENPAAAWMKCNDPIKDFDRIQSLVKAGFLVRTRADESTKQSRANDVTMRDRALASGAQFVSTDYPVPDARFSAYCVQLAGRVIERSNPVNGRSEQPPVDMEK